MAMSCRRRRLRLRRIDALLLPLRDDEPAREELLLPACDEVRPACEEDLPAEDEALLPCEEALLPAAEALLCEEDLPAEEEALLPEVLFPCEDDLLPSCAVDRLCRSVLPCLWILGKFIPSEDRPFCMSVCLL